MKSREGREAASVASPPRVARLRNINLTAGSCHVKFLYEDSVIVLFLDILLHDFIQLNNFHSLSLA